MHEGFTLAELLIVLAIIGIVGAVVIPAAAPSADTRLDTAAQEVINALRFARIEALRTGNVHGADFSVDPPATGTRRVRVFHAEPVDPPDPVYGMYDIEHPLNRTKRYDNQLVSDSATAGVIISDAMFYFQNDVTHALPPESSDLVAFDATGTPKRYLDAGNFSAYSTVDYVSAVTLTYQGNYVKVLLDPVTGRVTRS